MNNREKHMALGVGALVGLLMLYYVYSSIADQFTQRETKITQLEQTIAKNKQTILAGNVAKKRLTEWEHRSLPSNKEVAPTKYVNWLLEELVDHRSPPAEREGAAQLRRLCHDRRPADEPGPP